MKKLSGIEINLRSRAWSIHFDERNLYLTAIRNKINQVEFTGCETLEDYRDKSDEDVREFLEEFQRKHGVKRGDAFMLLPRSMTTVQIADFPLEAADNLEEVMSYQLENFFPVNLEEWAFFPQVIAKGEMLKVMITAVKNERLGEFFGYIRRWNLKLAGLTLDTFGLINGLAKTGADRFANERTAVFRFFNGGLEMAIVNQGRLAASHFFEVGSETAQEEIVTQLEQGFSQARLDPNEIDNYVAAGLAEPDLQAYLRDEVGLPFQPWRDVTGAEIPPEGLAGFGGAVTAVHEKPAFSLNMLPDNLRKRHRRLPIVLGATALIVAAIYILVGEVRDFRNDLESNARAEVQLAEVTERMNEVSKARSEYQAKLTQLQMFNRYQANNMLIKVLFSLSQDLPEHTFLTNMTIKDGVSLSIQGESDEPFEIQSILARMPFLRDVQPVNAITAGRNRDGKKRFNFRANIALEALK